MIKRRKWPISLVAGWLFLTVTATVGVVKGMVGKMPDAVLTADTVPLPALAYTIGRETDSVQSAAVLRPFFAGLDLLREGKDTVLTVVHIGDSHIQAGYYSGRVMRLLQARFGNAGRGWIAPFKLAKMNEPDDYFFTSTVREWTTGRCTQVREKCPVGPGGIGIRSLSPSIDFNVCMTPNNGAGYAFRQAILYRDEKAMPMLPTGRSKGIVRAALADSSVCGILADTFRISCLSDTLLLHSTRRKQGTDRLLPASSFRNIYYGVSLTNGQAGVLYHSVGVNGAMFVNYTDEDYMHRLALLHPSLLIVSLGTNESFGTRFNRQEFERQVRRFVLLVKAYMPQTAVLLTTPPECYRRTYVKKRRVYVRNTNMQSVARTLVRVAREEGLACWDLFTATGGGNSCSVWMGNGLFRTDRIHFTKEGYREQGTLLYRALMQTYNQFDAGRKIIRRDSLPTRKVHIDLPDAGGSLSVKRR